MHVLLDATICTLSNKTIIMPEGFFYEFKMILRDFGGGGGGGKKVTLSHSSSDWETAGSHYLTPPLQ
jgi:hypothetical protein